MRAPHSLIDVTRAVVIAVLCVSAGTAEAQVGFTGPVNDFAPASVGATDLVLEHDALGNVFAVWIAGANVWASRRTPGSRVWGEPIILQNPAAPTGDPEDPDIAVDDQGNAVVVWWRQPPGGFGGIVEHAYFHGGSVNQWTTAATVPGPVDPYYPEVVIDGLQRVTVTWYEFVPGFCLASTPRVMTPHYRGGAVCASSEAPETRRSAGTRDSSSTRTRTSPPSGRMSTTVSRHRPTASSRRATIQPPTHGRPPQVASLARARGGKCSSS